MNFGIFDSRFSQYTEALAYIAEGNKRATKQLRGKKGEKMKVLGLKRLGVEPNLEKKNKSEFQFFFLYKSWISKVVFCSRSLSYLLTSRFSPWR